MKKASLPQGGALSLAFNLDAMEALNAEFGEDYINETLRLLNLRDPKCLRLCVASMGGKTDLAEILKTMAVDDLVLLIADAINLALTGKKTGE
jgi:hypothetical protein